MRAGRDELVGRTVGEFVLREQIGEGGYGAVYRCEQPLLGREAVIKVLHGRLRASEVNIQRFLREARLASRLDHPYAAHVYAFGVEQDDGLMWIAMEMVHGTPLDRWLRDRGPLSLAELVPFFERIAEVVQTAHERGIVHRDIKPSNVMVIERAGRLLPKLLDLGIAKLLASDPDGTPTPTPPPRRQPPTTAISVDDTLTRQPPSAVETMTASAQEHAGFELTDAGAAIGSPPYMAPEQWGDGGSVGAASDIYALGVLAYEALAGRRPFMATTIAGFIDLHANARVPSLGGGFPAALDRCFERALAKRPRDRPATALELAATLRVASGLADSPTVLPKLDRGVHDAWIADAPQPLAEAVAALDAARNLHQARDAARELLHGLVRYLLVLALAARAQVREDREDTALRELLRALRQRDLDDAERVRLLRLLVAGFAGRSGAHPIPALVELLLPHDADGGPLDVMLRLDPSGDARADDLLRGHLVELVAALARTLRDASFVLDYPLLVVRGGSPERWTGLQRRPRRPLAVVQGELPPDDQPALVDRDGFVVVRLWPLVQALAPSPGADAELFAFAGRGRHGARLIAAPTGFERHDPAIWEWFGKHVLGTVGDGAAAAADERAPYLGLTTFSTRDAERFVGRERETDMFMNRLRLGALHVVVGASGAGKSSFVQAGVLPALPPGWRSITMRPGATPIATLAAKLELTVADLATPAVAAARLVAAAGEGAIVIVIDQLEELFTLCLDDGERARFAALIAELDVPVRVICTVRDDFLMRVEALPALGRRLAPAMFLLGNPSLDDLVRTIVEPARRAGYGLSDPELAHEMAAAVQGRPGALALLSFTASRLWELRDRVFKQLTRKAYDAMGGVGGALGHHAEATLTGLAADDQRLVREAFRRLVTAEGTRAQLSIAELEQVLASERAAAVIDKLVAARLLVTIDSDSGAQVEVAHEALLTAWPRVRDWVREDVEGARMRDRLAAAARQWETSGRSRGLLWRADVLVELERWRGESRSLTVVESAFADASRADATRGRRIRRGLVVGSFAVLAIALTIVFYLRNQATDQRQLAERRAEEIHAQLVDSLIDRGRRAFLAGGLKPAESSLGEASAMGARTPALRFLMARIRESHDAELATLRHDGQLRDASPSPDGTRVMTSGLDSSVRIWDAVTGRALFELRDHVPPVAAAWSATGDIATGDAAGTLRLFDGNGRLRHARPGSWSIETLAFRGDGAVLAIAGGPGTIAIVETRTGETRSTWAADPEGVNWLTFDPTGSRVLTAGHSSVVAWSLDGSAATRFEGHAQPIWHAVFDPHGRHVISASLDGTARVWNANTGAGMHVLKGHEARVTHVAVDATGRHIATASGDGTARIWSLATGEPTATLRGHTGQLNWVTFASADELVTAGADGTIRIWDVARGALTATFLHDGWVARANVDRSGKRLVTASWSGTAKLWDLRRQSRRVYSHALAHSDVYVRRLVPPAVRPCCLVRFGLDGFVAWDLLAGHQHAREIRGLIDGAVTLAGRVVVADSGGTIHTFGADTTIERRISAGTALAAVKVDPAGARIASCRDGSIDIWDATTGERLATRPLVGPNRLAISPDGELLVAYEQRPETSGGAVAWLFPRDLARAERLDHAAGLTDVSFAPNSAMFATLGLDGVVRVWNRLGKLEAVLRHPGPVVQAAWSANGDRLVVGTLGGTLLVWTRASWALPKVLEAHAGPMTAIAIGLDDSFVVTAGNDGTVKMWDVENLVPVRTWSFSEPVDHVGFDRDRLYISSGTTTQSWRTDLDHSTGQQSE